MGGSSSKIFKNNNKDLIDSNDLINSSNLKENENLVESSDLEENQDLKLGDTDKIKDLNEKDLLKYKETLLNDQDIIKNDTSLNTIEKLQKQLLILENIYYISCKQQDDLNKKIVSLQNSKVILENKELLISGEKLNEYIDNILKNDAINIGVLPDFAEKQLYKNILNLILNIIDNTFKNTSFKFLGHEIIVVLKPDYN